MDLTRIARSLAAEASSFAESWSGQFLLTSPLMSAVTASSLHANASVASSAGDHHATTSPDW
jgi:hypothetical protein